MKKILITLLFVVIFLIIGSSMVLCGQALTPAENIFTGNCKVFKTTCTIPIIYKKSEKCRTFWTIDTYLTYMQRYNETWEGYTDTKERINELCSSLIPKYQTELFQKYNVKSCSEITTFYNKN